jgi:hypothetical protein
MGNENSIPSEDSIFHPDNEHHSLKETAERFGYDGALAAWQGAGFELWPAMLLADAQSCMQGVEGAAKLLGADLHARIIGGESAGTFETLDAQSALDLSVGLQRLGAHARESLEQFLQVEGKAKSE